MLTRSKKTKINRCAAKNYPWATLPKEALLDVRLCDLNLEIKGTWLEKCVAQLYEELEFRGFSFRPHLWLSDEWFCPDGVPGFAIPFYLAHPRLKRLEKEHMLVVEGDNPRSCMKLLRHETGHAITNAYLIHHKRSWQQQFGKSSQSYPNTYLPKRYSKRFVINLDNWYAQSHPHEDWAETFAVWLKPHSDWRKRYQGWPALKKLQYVNQLMGEIHERRPSVRTKRQVHPLKSLRMTLREYYEEKQSHYAKDPTEFYDQDLRRLFSADREYHSNEKASHYIRRLQKEIIAIISRWTAEEHYRINEVIKEMIKRCNKLGLHIIEDNENMKMQAVAYLTMTVMNHMSSGGFHISL